MEAKETFCYRGKGVRQPLQRRVRRPRGRWVVASMAVRWPVWSGEGGRWWSDEGGARGERVR
jgi:hypothetical protein